jgi:acyl-CoA dehydrogenase family member 9
MAAFKHYARSAMETAAATEPPAVKECSSFSKALFLGEIHEGLVFPWPQPDPAEQDRIRALIASARELGESIDPREIEERRWIGDRVVRELGERGLCGLYVDERYGGQGLSQTGYARVFEAFAQIDATLSIVMGVHQSIGFKGIAMFGTDEQKERFLPDLAAGRKLAGFALTEPNAGSDAYNIESRAVAQPDGSWRLNGEKRFIGNGEKGSVFTTFARCEIDGRDRHIALIVEKGMKGFEVGERFDTMGLRGNDLRRLYFNDVRVPPENVLGAPGEGFRIAMEVLNNGRIGLGTGSVGATKGLLDRAIDHVKERRQFDGPLADLELVQDKIGWMVSYLFGLESMTYLTCGLVDAGVPDYSLESAVCKVAGTEFLWYAANRVLQLKGGEGYMRDQPYEKILRDIRIFPIFEGANDVLRSFVALSGIKPLGEKLSGLGELDLGDPIRSVGVLIDYVGERIQREVRPDKVSAAHTELDGHAESVSDQVNRLRDVAESLLRRHGREIVHRGFQHKRLADALADIYAQVAVLSRVSSIFEDQGVEPSGQERYIAETFCTRAAARVSNRFDQIDDNDDERMTAIAKLAYRRGEYGYALFED